MEKTEITGIDDLLNYINSNDNYKDKDKKKKKKKKSKKNKNEEINKNEDVKTEDKIEDIKQEEEKNKKVSTDSKKGEKQKKIFLKYLPKNINTDSENNSCSNKQEQRENIYRELIKPENNSEIINNRAQDNSHLRLIGNWQEKPNYTQTNPPTKSIDEQYNCLDDYPVGTIMEYPPNNIWRSTSEEKKELEKYYKYKIESMRKAGECHKQIRKYAQTIIKPGIKLIDMVQKIENMLRFITNQHLIECGQAFPTGCSLNNVAAHYTPNKGDETILKYDDVMKLDFGTQMNGYIIDCAFTVAFDPTYDNLLKASKEATQEGIKNAGIDVRLGELGGIIGEILNSYEVEIKGKTHKIKAIKDLCGHTMERFKIHGGKSVPLYRDDSSETSNIKMEEGELYAIETFATTGSGTTHEKHPWSHFMKNPDAFNNVKIKASQPKALFKYIDEHFSTMAFCPRWLEESGYTGIDKSLKYLCDHNLVEPYPPLADIEGCYTSQFEHSFMLKPTCKEIFSIDDDY